MTDADRERILDARIQRRLATDPAYRYAENAEQQAEREDEIALEEEYRLDRQLDALSNEGCRRAWSLDLDHGH